MMFGTMRVVSRVMVSGIKNQVWVSQMEMIGRRNLA
jgi:hypothetical protein